MSFSNDIPFNVADAWLSRAPGDSQYLFPNDQHAAQAFSPTHDEPFPQRDIFSLPMHSEPSLEPAFPSTPATSRSVSNTSPTEERGYSFGPSPDYTHPLYQRDTGYGTLARQRPIAYSPPFQQAVPLSPAPTPHPHPHPHRLHRRSSSVAHYPTEGYPTEAYPTERGSFHQPGLRCEWKGCRYNGAFGRKFELRRHVETQHISPGSFPCREPTCRMSYNRKDNLEDHMRRAHFYDI